MSGDIKRKQRMARLQKAKLSKAKMEHQSTLNAANHIENDLSEIQKLIEEEGLTVQVFPELTYGHVRKLNVAKNAVENSLREKRVEVTQQEARADQSNLQLRRAKDSAQRAFEEIEAVENTTRPKQK